MLPRKIWRNPGGIGDAEAERGNSVTPIGTILRHYVHLVVGELAIACSEIPSSLAESGYYTLRCGVMCLKAEHPYGHTL